MTIIIYHLDFQVTPNGFTIDRAIKSGVENQDSAVGLYAGDEVSAEVTHVAGFKIEGAEAVINNLAAAKCAALLLSHPYAIVTVNHSPLTLRYRNNQPQESYSFFAPLFDKVIEDYHGG